METAPRGHPSIAASSRFANATATKRFPSSRCASATKIVCPCASTVATQPQVQPALLSLSAIISQDCFTGWILAFFFFRRQRQSDMNVRGAQAM
jgi:hypothetical protein